MDETIAAATAAATAAVIVAADVQRSLGRIEGKQEQILRAQESLEGTIHAHTDEDRINFAEVSKLIYQHRGEVRAQFEEQNRARNQHLNEQDVKLDSLKQDRDRAKGAGWVILGLLGTVATILGGAVLSVFNGWLRV